MCGIMLKHHGHNVKILEKEKLINRGDYDAGIKIGPDVDAFLTKHCRLSNDFTITCKAPVKFNIEGKAKPEHKQTMRSTSWGLFISILRANFDGVTSKAFPIAPAPEQGQGTVVFRNGAKVLDVKDLGNNLKVQFEDVQTRAIQAISADLVIVADGSTSLLRQILLLNVQRQYAGYVAWRGTVKEDDVDKEASAKYSGKFAFHLMDRSYLLHYTVPTDEGILDPGKRLHNWIWYQYVEEGSQEMETIFTDVNGTEHQSTLPRGLLDSKVWEKQKALASSKMPQELTRLISSTSSPFVSKIYDVASPKAVFFGGKLFLVGDALTTIRANAGMSTSHAAFNCNKLEQVIKGKLSPKGWEKAVLRFGAAQQRFGMMVASFGLDSKLVAAWNAIWWLLLLLGQRIGLM
ncbi:hypothetical protein DM02DRAFT_596190 [Periconia macrospinosa]|uniref:2,6-dihydroxypyridine 3-monooxygenase substrate binding domain-containing protein n=1 Tax=Periconia macrospinosa TaxID=97972 RepID=A0A2V1DJI6_9PLEO|nr:hypothetical protein DM02DRAFT_596190 [Periconia macrospinosa]